MRIRSVKPFTYNTGKLHTVNVIDLIACGTETQVFDKLKMFIRFSIMRNVGRENWHPVYDTNYRSCVDALKEKCRVFEHKIEGFEISFEICQTDGREFDLIL